MCVIIYDELLFYIFRMLQLLQRVAFYELSGRLSNVSKLTVRLLISCDKSPIVFDGKPFCVKNGDQVEISSSNLMFQKYTG